MKVYKATAVWADAKAASCGTHCVQVRYRVDRGDDKVPVEYFNFDYYDRTVCSIVLKRFLNERLDMFVTKVNGIYCPVEQDYETGEMLLTSCHLTDMAIAKNSAVRCSMNKKLQEIKDAIENNGQYDYEVVVDEENSNVSCDIYCYDVVELMFLCERVNKLGTRKTNGLLVNVWVEGSRVYFAPKDPE